jgi:hypothetical protein
MDDVRFDALTRALGEATTRRGLTRLLAGLALGGLLGPISSDAKKHGKGKSKRKSKGKDKGKQAEDRGVGTEGKKGHGGRATITCRAPGQSCSRNAQCCSSKCVKGTCRCTQASQCPDPGPCKTRVCTAAGACTPQPAPPDTPCGDGDACTEGSRCDGQGTCVAGTAKSCDDGVACTRDGCEPATGCTHTPDDTQCDGGKVCDRQDGCVCPQGTRECGNRCVDTQSDPDHCGACGTACDGGAGTCRGGVCATPEVCDGDDNDLDGEVDEGAHCPSNKVCQGGACVCPAGTRDCDGDDACEQLGTDQHCAGCNDACGGGQVCQGGTCVTTCGDGVCNGSETCSNCPADCGQCPTSTCGDGTCEAFESCNNCPEDCGPCLGCTTDDDCVPEGCCHPYSCIPRAQAPVCGDIACSTECAWFTLDCGQGYCSCQSGQCVAVFI